MEHLTPRQRQIAKLVCAGISNKQIGYLLGIAEGTVKVHLNTIYNILSITSRTMLMAMLIGQQ